MAIDLLKQFEDVPAAYPDPPAGLSADAAALDADLIWGRIEAYCAHRWTPREVAWTILGDAGDQWRAPLTPIMSSTASGAGDVFSTARHHHCCVACGRPRFFGAIFRVQFAHLAHLILRGRFDICQFGKGLPDFRPA